MNKAKGKPKNRFAYAPKRSEERSISRILENDHQKTLGIAFRLMKVSFSLQMLQQYNDYLSLKKPESLYQRFLQENGGGFVKDEFLLGAESDDSEGRGRDGSGAEYGQAVGAYLQEIYARVAFSLGEAGVGVKEMPRMAPVGAEPDSGWRQLIECKG